MALNIEQRIESLLNTWSRMRRGAFWLFLIALLRSRYFLISMGFYVGLLLLIGTVILTKYPSQPSSVFDTPEILSFDKKPKTKPPEPKPLQPTPDARDFKVTPSASSPTKTLDVLSVKQSDSPIEYLKPRHDVPVTPTVLMPDLKPDSDLRARIIAYDTERLQLVRDFQKPWEVEGTGPQTRAKFTVFQAKYQDGDWNCNPEALFNLLLQVRRWSKNRIEANMYPQVLNIGSDELFTLKPPFVYLTGHKDFHLLDQEVKNIRDYLMLGGAVWADSALVGRRSRFDVAFRREMKRVFPDRDFEDVPPKHELFDQFFDKLALPEGMNYYQEPVECINIGKEMAVIYTLNGYGHFWEARLKETKNQIEWNQVIVGTNLNALIRSRARNRGRDIYGPRPVYAYVYGPHARQNIVCRNYNDQTVTDSYKFGINVIVHLLTRYQKYFKLLPIELPAKAALHDKPGGNPIDMTDKIYRRQRRDILFHSAAS